MADTIKGVKIKALPEKDSMTDTDILVIEDSEATKQISAEAMKTYFIADLSEQIQKLKDENAELSDELQDLKEKNTELSNEMEKLENENTELSNEMQKLEDENAELSDELQKLENENTELSSELYKSVEFYNGDEWLETVVVMRGDDAVYTGDTPVSTDNPNAAFLRWEPEPSNIKENLKCYAQYSPAFAVYSASDNSLTFYTDDVFPTEGNIYNDKIVTNIYVGFDINLYNANSNVPWYSRRTDIINVVFDKSFANIQPVGTAFWFYGFTNCTEINGLKYLNTSSVTTMYCMFHTCSGLTTLDVSGFNTSSVTNMSAMFQMCSGLTTLDVSGFNTGSVTNMSGMFYYCNNIVTIYSNDILFVTTNVTNGSTMFSWCSKLVGGNGTVYSSSKATYEMAHVDTADNPGYFTAK